MNAGHDQPGNVRDVGGEERATAAGDLAMRAK